MRETRTYGSEGGEIGSTDLPYPYPSQGGTAGLRRFQKSIESRVWTPVLVVLIL
jgi:hypothetical protein